MPAIRLTDRFIASLAPPDVGRIEVSDAIRPGLRLRVAVTGKKVWIYEKRIKGGVKRKHTLGPFPTVSIGEARRIAAELEVEAIRGIDRVELEMLRREEEARTKVHQQSVGKVLLAYSRLHLKNLKSGDERQRVLSQALAKFSDAPISDLSRADLQKIVDAKASEGALIAANRLKAALSHFAKFAWERGYTEIHVGLGLAKAVSERPRDRVLTIPEVQAIWRATEPERGVFGPLVRLMILTAQRRSEIAGLKWSNVNFEKRRLEMRAKTTKADRAHITHLSDPALLEIQAVCSANRLSSEYVFTTTGKTPVSGFSVLKRRLDARLGPAFEPWRFHDLRTAFATAMAEAGEAEGLVDRVINHAASGSAPSAVARVYNQAAHLPERARILDRWARMLLGSEAEVIAMHA